MTFMYSLISKAIGPGKKYKIINVGPTSIPESRVSKTTDVFYYCKQSEVCMTP